MSDDFTNEAYWQSLLDTDRDEFYEELVGMLWRHFTNIAEADMDSVPLLVDAMNDLHGYQIAYTVHDVQASAMIDHYNLSKREESERLHREQMSAWREQLPDYSDGGRQGSLFGGDT